MGLVNLKYINQILAQRKDLSCQYDTWLDSLNLKHQSITPHSDFNYSYYPVVFKNEETTCKVVKELEANWVTPRRYFYPSLNTIKIFNTCNSPISESIASRVLCLPLYHTMTNIDVDFVSRIILRAIYN
jgi:dTDP-4-amino-4,6-dideoxygalactose transaminase